MVVVGAGAQEEGRMGGRLSDDPGAAADVRKMRDCAECMFI